MDAVAEAQRLKGVVGHQQHGAPAQQLGGEALQTQPGDRVERREGLVHEHDGPVFHEAADKRYPLAHAARQGARIITGALGEPDRGEQIARPLIVGLLTAQAAADDRILDHRKPRHEQVLLRHIGNAAGDRMTGIGRFQPGEQAQQAGLADSRRTQQTSPPSLFQGHVEAVEQHAPGIAQGGVVDTRRERRGS